MRSLRERLKAVCANQAAAPTQGENTQRHMPQEPLFCREHIIALDHLGGIERVTLNALCACDPAFSGERFDLTRTLFIDTETTGLSGGAGTVAFEIGAGMIDERGLVVQQYVMRNYAQEAQMLAEIARLFSRADTVITFNGKSFDLPLLQSRMVMARIRMNITELPHFDLLHAARRVYKLRLGRCNLSALESAVLGQARADDLPGAQVPQRYFDYIKTGEFALLEDVLRHNLQDVVSLAQLTAHLCGVFEAPQTLAHPQDMLGVGKTLLRTGHTQRARTCLKILGHSTLAPQAHMVLAKNYKQSREWQEAVQLWQTMIAHGEGGIMPYIELAKYFEHVIRDYDRALAYTRGALTAVLNTAPIMGANGAQLCAIDGRMKRLQRKRASRLEKMKNEKGDGYEP